MPLPTPSAIPLEALGPWLALVAFGAYHGLNPGMGWLFALSLGLQRKSERAVWGSLAPIALGHAASVTSVAILVTAGLRFVSMTTLQWLSALVLIAFGIYKLFNYYRHPRWVGMNVGGRDLVVWSFLMATAHGAGLMIVPALLGVTATQQHAPHMAMTTAMPHGTSAILAVGVHTLAMLVVMGLVAWTVYKKLGLAVLRQRWINFDLIWAGALLAVGGITLVMAL